MGCTAAAADVATGALATAGTDGALVDDALLDGGAERGNASGFGTTLATAVTVAGGGATATTGAPLASAALWGGLEPRRTSAIPRTVVDITAAATTIERIIARRRAELWIATSSDSVSNGND